MDISTQLPIDPASLIHSLCENYWEHNCQSIEDRDHTNIYRGLRNPDGTGVMIGFTEVGSVIGYSVIDNERVPMEGHLRYRGYDLRSLVDSFSAEKRFGYAETAYLLLFGELPTQEKLRTFNSMLHACTALPTNFTEDMILKNPSKDIMNKLARSVLALYSTDANPDDTSLENMLRQSIELIARFPLIVSQAYAVKRHYFDNQSLFLHRPIPEFSNSENILHLIRPDGKFTEEEARLLDFCLVCHADHGGGNNSTFTCRNVSSTGSDTYSAIAAAVGSLKGPKHGGASTMVVRQFEEVKAGVRDWKDDDEVASFIRKILNKEVGDHTGLVYGMGHAVYTLSDPRAVILKEKARTVAKLRGMSDELSLMEAIERVTPKVFSEMTGSPKIMCANVDMYSGLIYRMLDIPQELYTPLFAVARISGWCAHRIEEVLTGRRIYRPAFKAIVPCREYIPLKNR